MSLSRLRLDGVGRDRSGRLGLVADRISRWFCASQRLRLGKHPYLTALLVSQPLHFGDYGGMPMQILWALLDIATIVVLGSGLYLWLKKGNPVHARDPKVHPPAPVPTASQAGDAPQWVARTDADAAADAATGGLEARA